VTRTLTALALGAALLAGVARADDFAATDRLTDDALEHLLKEAGVHAEKTRRRLPDRATATVFATTVSLGKETRPLYLAAEPDGSGLIVISPLCPVDDLGAVPSDHLAKLLALNGQLGRCKIYHDAEAKQLMLLGTRSTVGLNGVSLRKDLDEIETVLRATRPVWDLAGVPAKGV
jgi:hypothetical protein